MKRSIFCLLCGAVFSLSPALAIESGSSFNTTEPTNTDIANWTSGWASGGITGWDYVGTVNGASGVYLGNNWVLTAAHVGSGTFILDGTSYSAVAGSSQSIETVIGMTDEGPADLTLFQVSGTISLPALTLSSSAPTPASITNPGSSMAMLGFGGGNESWGYNSVTANNLLVSVEGYPYVSVDFETAYGTTAYGSVNNAKFIVGDSGGGDFTYNSSTHSWELAGINEATDGSSNSYMVELAFYKSQIAAIVATPEPGTWASLLLGLILMAFAGRRLRPSHQKNRL